jgi:hypothetical protein
MEKRSRRRVPELVTRPAFQGLSENEIGRARISMMASNATFRSRAGYKAQDLSRPAAGPYRRIIRVGAAYTSKRKDLRCQTATSCAFGDKALFWQVSRLKRTPVAARAEQPNPTPASLLPPVHTDRLCQPHDKARPFALAFLEGRGIARLAERRGRWPQVGSACPSGYSSSRTSGRLGKWRCSPAGRRAWAPLLRRDRMREPIADAGTP